MTDGSRNEALISGLIDEAARAFPQVNAANLAVDRQALQDFCQQLLKSQKALDEGTRGLIVDQVCDELLGFGPIQSLMQDPGVSDILINGWDKILYEKAGRLHPFAGTFLGPEHLRAFVFRHVARAERSVNRSRPWVDVELSDGSRMHVIADPVALGGPFVSIRRFPERPFSLEDLESFGAITPQQRQWLEAAVDRRLNMIIAGAPGSGKTTLLGALLARAPGHERIVLVEDVSELKVNHPHCIKLQTRNIAHGDSEQATIRKLVRETLRMRPDRLVVGEVRGEEVFDMIAAMSIGLSGSLSTLHAGSVTGALHRLETLYASATSGQSGVDPARALRDAVNAIVYLERDAEGRRRVADIHMLGEA